MNYRLESGMSIDLTQSDLRGIHELHAKHGAPEVVLDCKTSEAMYAKACRNLEHIAEWPEGKVHDEESIKCCLALILRHGTDAECAEATYEAAEAAAYYAIMTTKTR